MDAPAYLALHQSGKLGRRILAAQQLLRPCRLCPRTCNVDRLAGEPGFCGVASLVVVAAWQPHFGEEACLHESMFLSILMDYNKKLSFSKATQSMSSTAR
ncbi:MAG: hypothetical protein V3573_13895 [Desulfovibrionaceae bacterium]